MRWVTTSPSCSDAQPCLMQPTSWAIVLWELLTRQDLYPGKLGFQLAIEVGTEGLRPEIPEDVPVRVVVWSAYISRLCLISRALFLRFHSNGPHPSERSWCGRGAPIHTIDHLSQKS